MGTNMNSGPANSNVKSSNSHPRRVVQVIIVLIVLIAVMLTGVVVFQKHAHKPSKKAASVLTQEEDFFKKSSNLSSMRSLLAIQKQQGKYEAALITAKNIQGKTHANTDSISVLMICADTNIKSKNMCLQNMGAKLKNVINQLTFRQALTVARILDTNNMQAASVDFYQRSYDTYSSTDADEYTQTKEQIGVRINELNK